MLILSPSIPSTSRPPRRNVEIRVAEVYPVKIQDVLLVLARTVLECFMQRYIYIELLLLVFKKIERTPSNASWWMFRHSYQSMQQIGVSFFYGAVVIVGLLRIPPAGWLDEVAGAVELSAGCLQQTTLSGCHHCCSWCWQSRGRSWDVSISNFNV